MRVEKRRFRRVCSRNADVEELHVLLPRKTDYKEVTEAEGTACIAKSCEEVVSIKHQVPSLYLVYAKVISVL